MEMEMVEQVDAVEASSVADTFVERLMEVAIRLEESIARLTGREAEISASGSLEERLREAEATIAALRGAGRKTTGAGAGTAALQAKEAAAVDAGSLSGVLDSALVSLSLEQRIAVKSQLMRSGLLG